MDDRTKKILLFGGGILLLALLLWFLLAPESGGAPTGPEVTWGMIGGGDGVAPGYGFSWSMPESGAGNGYELSYMYEVRNPANEIIAKETNSTANSVLIPMPYMGGTYSIAVAAVNQFGPGPETMASGKIEIPSVASWTTPWTEGCITPNCNNRPWWDAFLTLKDGKAGSVSFSAVLANGDYMPQPTTGSYIKDVVMQSADGISWTCSESPMPKLRPPFEDGYPRGTPFKWVVVVAGGWGQFVYEKDDSIPGSAPSAVATKWDEGTPLMQPPAYESSSPMMMQSQVGQSMSWNEFRRYGD